MKLQLHILKTKKESDAREVIKKIYKSEKTDDIFEELMEFEENK